MKFLFPQRCHVYDLSFDRLLSLRSVVQQHKCQGTVFSSVLRAARFPKRLCCRNKAGLLSRRLALQTRTTSGSRLLQSNAALILLPQKSKTAHASGSWLLSTAAIPQHASQKVPPAAARYHRDPSIDR